MITFYARPRRVRDVWRVQSYKGQSELVRVDWSAWAEENGAVTSVTWSLEAGEAGIASESLASNLAQAQITTGTEGWSLVKVTGTSGSDIDVRYIAIRARDPQIQPSDYGLCV